MEMEMEMEKEKVWGSWEELVLGGAVLRHGAASWTAVAAEFRSRTKFPQLFSPQECKAKFREVQERYSGSETWFEELRKQRVADLKRELEKSDNSIGSLQTKIASLSTNETENSSHDIISSSSKEYQSKDMSIKNRETNSSLKIRESNSGLEIRETNSSLGKFEGRRSNVWCWGFQKKRARRESGTDSEGKLRREWHGFEANLRRENDADSEGKLRREIGMDYEANLRRENDVDSEANLRREGGTESEANVRRESALDSEAKSDVNLRRESGTESEANLRRESGKESEANLRRESGTESEAKLTRERCTDSETNSRREGCTDSEANSSSPTGTVGEEGSSVSYQVSDKDDFENNLDLEGVFKILWENKECSVFKRRLESQKKIMYKKMIRRHLDLQTVSSKLNKGLIFSPKELFRDFLLIANNALVFYPKNSTEYKSAIVLRNLANKTLKKCLNTSCGMSLTSNCNSSSSVGMESKELDKEVNMEIEGVVKKNVDSENDGVLKKKVDTENDGVVKDKANSQNEGTIKRMVRSENEGNMKKKEKNNKNEGVIKKKVDSENEQIKKKKENNNKNEGAIKKKADSENEQVKKKKESSQKEGLMKKKVDSENEGVKKKKAHSEHENIIKKKTNTENEGVKKKKSNIEDEKIIKKNVNNENKRVRNRNVNNENENEEPIKKKRGQLLKGGKLVNTRERMRARR